MSATTRPIPPAAFALAIADLPLASLHAKAAELRNSIAHLLSSNEQLVPFADEGDRVCADAIRENEEVVRRMEERILLLRREVEGRGMRWYEAEEEEGREVKREGEGEVVGGVGVVDVRAEGAEGAEDRTANGEVRTGENQEAGTGAQPRQQSGRLTDEELTRLLRERMVDPGEEEGGMHL